jgi:hypothetical protein
VFHQFVRIVEATVGQFPFGQRPDSLIGVELRSIGRKVLDAQAATLAWKLFDRRSLVCGVVISMAFSELLQAETSHSSGFFLENRPPFMLL